MPSTSRYHSKPLRRQYGTLRNRIQSGMFYSAMFSTILLMMLTIFLILISFLSLGVFFSKSVNQDIYTRLDTLMQGTVQRPQGPDISQLKSKSLDEIMIYATQVDTDKVEVDMMAESMVPKQIVISEFNEDVQKMVAISIISTMSDFQQTLPFKKWLTLNMVLVEFSNAKGEKILCMPVDESGGNSIEAFQNSTLLQKPLLKPMFEQSLTHLTLISTEGQDLATITTSINPNFIVMLLVVIVIMAIIVMIAIIPINLLLIKFNAKNIIKPVTQLNVQMAALAKNDFYSISDFQFQVKKPPQELVKLMDSATQIMERMNDNNMELDAQKQELEAQNTELEAQNIALLESKAMIQHQQDQLVRSEKMATLGQISAAIAHEINTPLGAIKSNSQMMAMVLEQLHTEDQILGKKIGKLKDMNSISVTASERVTEIIKSLKNFSRIDQADFQNFDIHEGLDSVLVLTSNLWKNTITIDKQYGSIPPIEGFASMLNQVFMNIVVNAIQAMGDQGTLTLQTSATDSFVRIAFKDTGGGIPATLAEKVFESGYTTKEAHQGTGLGLAISRDIIAKHKGRIYVESTPGQIGATFVVELPIAHS